MRKSSEKQVLSREKIKVMENIKVTDISLRCISLKGTRQIGGWINGLEIPGRGLG